tara:strand:- start:68 stop:1384 length:1317 start_codon:yes stop_codon:yes gene_type:complete
MKFSLVTKYFLYKKILLYFVKFLLIFNLIESTSYSEIDLNTNWKQYDKNRKTTFFYSTDVRKVDYGMIESGDVSVGKVGVIKMLTLEFTEDYEVIGSVRYNYMISYRVVRCDNFTQNRSNYFYNQLSKPSKYSSTIHRNGKQFSVFGIPFFYLKGSVLSDAPTKIKQKKLLKIGKKFCKDFFPNGVKIKYSKEFLREKKRQELIKNYKYISLIEHLKNKTIYNQNENTKYSFSEDKVVIKSTFGKWTTDFTIKDDGYLYLEYLIGSKKVSEAFDVENKKIILWRGNGDKYEKKNFYLYDVNNPKNDQKIKKTSNKIIGRSMYPKDTCCTFFRIDPNGWIFFNATEDTKKFNFGKTNRNKGLQITQKVKKYESTNGGIIFGPIDYRSKCKNTDDLLNLRDCDENFNGMFKIVENSGIVNIWWQQKDLKWKKWTEMRYER